jgi:hypothetical protein
MESSLVVQKFHPLKFRYKVEDVSPKHLSREAERCDVYSHV